MPRGCAAPAPPAPAPAVTPVAQRMAQEHGVDLSRVTATGPAAGSRVTTSPRTWKPARRPRPLKPRPARPCRPAGAGRRTGSRRQRVHLPRCCAPRLGAGGGPAPGSGTGEGGRITKKDVQAFAAGGQARQPRRLPRPAAPEELPIWERPGSGDLFKPTEGYGEPETAAAPASPPAPAQQPAPSPRPPQAAERAAVPAAPGAESEVVPLSNIRRSIAKHMVLSKQTSPHVTTVMEADLTRVVQARERFRRDFERQGTRLTFTPFFLQAIVAGLKAVPEANSSFREDALLVHRRIHIGMAVAIADGLIVPVIRDADEKSLLGLARAVNDLAERARARQLQPDEVQGGTFTLTNHGTAGSLFATPIINQPQAGILGVGAIQKRPVVISRGSAVLPDCRGLHRRPADGLPELHLRPPHPGRPGGRRFPGGSQGVPGRLPGMMIRSGGFRGNVLGPSRLRPRR